eukprot:gene8638-biopygen15179
MVFPVSSGAAVTPPGWGKDACFRQALPEKKSQVFGQLSLSVVLRNHFLCNMHFCANHCRENAFVVGNFWHSMGPIDACPSSHCCAERASDGLSPLYTHGNPLWEPRADLSTPHGHPRLGCTFRAFVGFVWSPEGCHDPCWAPRLAALKARRGPWALGAGKPPDHFPEPPCEEGHATCRTKIRISLYLPVRIPPCRHRRDPLGASAATRPGQPDAGKYAKCPAKHHFGGRGGGSFGATRAPTASTMGNNDNIFCARPCVLSMGPLGSEH